MALPTLTYPGKLDDELLGCVKGPTMQDEYVTCTATEYRVDKTHPAGVTIATFSYGIRCHLCGGLIAGLGSPPSQLTRAERLQLRVRHSDACLKGADADV